LIKRVAFDTAVEEVKLQYKSSMYDSAKKAVSVEINLIFTKMTIGFKELIHNNGEIFDNKDIFDFEIKTIKG